MSAVQGPKRELKEFTKKTGFFEGQVVCFNPDREALEKLLGTQIEKDPEYLSTDEDGNTKLRVSVWIKNVDGGEMRNVNFFLRNVVRENSVKEGENKTKKTQFINEVGTTTWADEEDNLPDWFKERPYRPAREGEEEFYNFMTNWLSELDLRKPDARLSFDWKKLMKGNLKEVSEQIQGEYAKNIVCLVCIRAVTKDGEVKEYEQIYNRGFLPGFVMKQIRSRTISDAELIENARLTDKKKRSMLQKFVLNITDSKFGIKDHYTLRELQDYDPSKNVAASDKTNIPDNDTSY